MKLISGYVISREKERGTGSQADSDVGGLCNTTQDAGDVTGHGHGTQDV